MYYAGLTATPEVAQETHAYIRSWFVENYSDTIADDVIIQYGGSVNDENVDELMARAPVHTMGTCTHAHMHACTHAHTVAHTVAHTAAHRNVASAHPWLARPVSHSTTLYGGL